MKNLQKQYKSFENICPLAELGNCILARDATRFYGLCSTPDYESCSQLDSLIPESRGLFSMIFEKDEE